MIAQILNKWIIYIIFNKNQKCNGGKITTANFEYQLGYWAEGGFVKLSNKYGQFTHYKHLILPIDMAAFTLEVTRNKENEWWNIIGIYLEFISIKI